MTAQAPPPTKNEIVRTMSAMIRTVDERAQEVNRKWGFNRLPHLVPLDWLEKFRNQKRKWELALFECAGSPKSDDIERIRKQGDAMLRAFDKLEELAVAEGHMPTPPEWWEFELEDGTPVLLVRSRAEMSQVDPQGRAVQIWSLDEIAHVIAKFPKLVLGTKETFPGAEIIQCRTNPAVVGELNDSLAEMPFDP